MTKADNDLRSIPVINEIRCLKKRVPPVNIRGVRTPVGRPLNNKGGTLNEVYSKQED